MGSIGPTTLVFLLAVPAIILLPARYIPAALSCSLVAALGLYWEGFVTSIVPEPYLDEIFHIPQAQAYCKGDFDVWDPKLTTPPGLYLVSTFLLSPFGCTVEALRTLNALTLTILLLPLFACRNLIYIAKGQNWEAAHTALNICLFPPLFFVSGLYYTDVLSTLLVVLTYGFYLGGASSFVRGLGIYFLGIVALGMRQTNVFWTAVFLAGLEWVRTCKAETTFVPTERHDEPSMIREWGDKMEQWTHGLLHDPKLQDAGVTDVFLCVLSIAVAALFCPILLLTRIWPYIALLLSFAGFVFWNGGVVLGDKANHVATIHIPQILYLWPFVAFFSLPLLYPYALETLAAFFPISVAKYISLSSSKPKAVKFISYSVLATLGAAIVVKFNTIVHPFTLADNRHYMFYVFRYTILRHPLAKFALTPFYVLGAWLVLRCLGGIPSLQPQTSTSRKGVSKTAPNQETEGVDTSFALIWFLSTTLSLITAPLVEPRYFIIPWVIWRLNVPSVTSASLVVPIAVITPPPYFPLTTSNGTQNGLTTTFSTSEPVVQGDKVENHDRRLYSETLWFICINVVTGYLFLYRGFEWPQEPGKIQRFMW